MPIELSFFGKPKAFDVQSFDTKLEEFRDEAYAAIPEEHNYPRARCLIDRGIDAIKILLKNIWGTPEKLAIAKVPFMIICLKVDNNYTAYSVTIRLLDASYFYRDESFKSSNFDEAVQAEMGEMFKKYGFSAPLPKQYRVKFENHEAVLSEREVNELCKEHPELYFDIKEVK